MFENELREHIGDRTQVVTPDETFTGILTAVGAGTVTVRTSPYPGYGEPDDVTVGIGSIAYVRFFV